MALFCVAIRRDSVSLLKFSFRSHVHVFSCRISLVCRLKYPYSCFSSLFPCYCSINLYVSSDVIITFHFLFSHWCIRTIFNAGESSSSFFPWHIESMSSLGCKALCIVICFLVLWFIYWSSSLVHFKNGPEYLTKDTVQVFIPLMKFLPRSLVSETFLDLLRYLFLFFILSPLVCYCQLRIFPSTCNFPFLQASCFFLILAVLILSLFVFFHFSLLSWHIFLCWIPFLHLDCIFLFFVLVSTVFFFSFFANSLMSSMYIKWLIFFCDLVNLTPPVHFLSMLLIGIIAFSNYNGESASLDLHHS